MKPNNVNNQNKRHQSRWVITSATAMILTTLTIASQAAAADDTVTTTTNEPTNSQLNTNTQVNATQVNLKADTSTSVSTIKSDQSAVAATSPTTSTGSPSEHSSSVNTNPQQQSANPASQSQATTTSESTPTTDIKHPTQTAPAQTTSASTTEPTTESNTESATDSQAKATTTDNQASKQPSQQAAPASSNSTTTEVNTQSATSSASTDDKIVTSVNQEKLVLKTNQPVVRAISRTASENINDWMPNTLLQQEVLSQLRKQNPDRTWNSAADITKADMLLLTTYYGKDTYIDGKTSYSLEGLQYATNLTTVWLNNNLNAPSGSYYSDVTDISPLANLQKLQVVNIQQNRITDISPLANLKNLTEVDAAYNHISDFSPLKGFKNLKGTFSNQFITLPPAYISADNNIATLAIDCYLPDGSKVQLKPNNGVGETVFYKNGQLYVRWYFNGAGRGNYDSNGHIYYTNMKPQQPGLTGPTFNGTTVIPMADYYFMTAASDGNNFVVVRPYVLAATAAPITVKYVDALTGESLVTADLTLNGIVGQPYTTQRIDDELPNYDFTNIVGNASGVFTADAQTVTYYYTRKDAGDITIHMVDTNGNLVYEPQILPGKHNLGNAYNLDAPTFDHFKLQQTIGNAAGVFTTDPQSITFVYVRLDAGNITVKYQDKQGHQLKPDKTVSGSQSLGQTYTTEPLGIENYTLMTTPANATGTFTDQEQTVIYVYVRRDAGQIVVKYQDSAGNPLAPDKLLDGKEQLGVAYQTAAISIPNFYLVATPANATGQFSDQAQTVIYVYTREDAGDITVQYLDENGQQLAADSVLSGQGQLGQPYETSPLNINGYTVKSTQGNTTGTYTVQPQRVVYIYDRTAGQPVTAKYQDQDGKSIHPDVVHSGYLGDSYSTEQLVIDGYTFKAVQGDVSGTFGTSAKTVTYVYERTAGLPVTAKYLDEHGKSIHPDVVHSGYLGDSYSTEQLVIDGYTFKAVQGDVSGTFGTTAKTVTYVYTENTPTIPDTQGTVTVHYMTKDGIKLNEPTVLSGKTGTTYQTVPLTFTDHELVGQPENATGLFTADNVDVTYVYQTTDTTGTDDIIDPEQPTKPIKPVEPTTPETPHEPGTTVTQPDRIKPTQPAVAVKPVATVKPTLKPAAAQASLVKTTSPVTEHSAQLPQTDEQTGKLAVILGLLLSIVTFGFYGKHRQS
ncbi:MucBP domain-containing protein [Lactiplantibacillus plantarum]|uniref:MucBP domain-containing protein n=1 Tax=Lactiplantibacillus plantarum TaxID=1590 RepID=UPI001E2E5793|nr:MucBP domain-containing protein [Lactiplantibacillus plantarum]MCC6119988.1 MucBP domain-containing protein [Lactiplantibacillus plantarum]MCT3240599.1 LPXTG cell wall anchor domain-containing protein [Lactiplantibacillus plantarum]MCW6136471.1 MucBP domain-containing protein [Lactiplantibacillus plantarum]